MPRRPRVLLIGNYPPPFGGIPTHLASLAPSLLARGWSVEVLSLKYRGSAPAPFVHSPTARTRFAKARLLFRALSLALRTPAALRLPWWDLYRATDLLDIATRLHRGQPFDAVAAYHVLPSGLVAHWLKTRVGVPYIVTVFGEFFSDARLATTLAPLSRAVLDSADFRLSCSRHCAASADRIGAHAPVDTLYYGIDVAHFTPGAASAARARLGVPNERPVVAFVGRHDREMGGALALAAFRKLRDRTPRPRLLLAGRRGDLTAEFEAAAGAEPDDILVRTDVPFAALPDVYRSADVVVVPSLNDRACLGLAVAEAMACGVPTVVSRAGGGPEVCRDGETGTLVPAGDVDATAAATAALLADGPRRAVMAAASRAWVVAEFDTDLTNTRMSAALERLLR